MKNFLFYSYSYRLFLQELRVGIWQLVGFQWNRRGKNIWIHPDCLCRYLRGRSCEFPQHIHQYLDFNENPKRIELLLPEQPVPSMVPSPLNPNGQEHSNPPLVLSHPAPAAQGLLKHSLTSSSQKLPVQLLGQTHFGWLLPSTSHSPKLQLIWTHGSVTKFILFLLFCSLSFYQWCRRVQHNLLYIRIRILVEYRHWECTRLPFDIGCYGMLWFLEQWFKKRRHLKKWTCNMGLAVISGPFRCAFASVACNCIETLASVLAWIFGITVIVLFKIEKSVML